MTNQLLFTPGPVPLPEDIAHAGANVEIYHQSDAFASYVHDLSRRLQEVFLASTPVLMMSGSSMSAIDACAASLQRQSDVVLVLHHGRFGERIRDITRLYSDSVVSMSAPWGEHITADDVERQCASMERLDMFWCVHSETSTGVSLDLQAIASIVRRHHPHALVCVDAVTSIAIQEFRMDAWDIDVAVTGIQKGLSCSPGLALIGLSERARMRTSESRPLYTLDLHRVCSNLDAGRMTWTPPTSLMAQLSTSIDSIRAKGLPDVWQHHEMLYREVRLRAEQRGFVVWGHATSRGVLVLEHSRAEEIRHELEHRWNMIVAGGQDQMAGKVLRFGLCGSYTVDRYTMLFDAIDTILSR